MKEYPKINSLWKREGWYFDEKKKKDPSFQKGRQSFIIGDYACPEFGNVKTWHVEEKIDGTNIRVHVSSDFKVRFGGRTSRAAIPAHLLSALQEIFEPEILRMIFEDPSRGMPEVTLYGEGYGPKIQAAGSFYRDDPFFILFDVLIGNWWLMRNDVDTIANKLGVPCAPFLGYMTEDEIVEFVKSKPLSTCSKKDQVMEGVVCRPAPTMLFRNGEPIMFKLKTKEF